MLEPLQNIQKLFPYFFEKRKMVFDWQKALLAGEDYFQLLSENPRFDQLENAIDNLNTTALAYYWFSPLVFSSQENTKLFCRHLTLHIGALQPYCQTSDTRDDANLFHFLGYSSNVAAIEWATSEQLPETYQALVQKKDKLGCNFLQWIAFSGKKVAIEYALSDQLAVAYRAQLQEQDNLGRNFLHMVPHHADLDAIQYVLSEQLPDAYRAQIQEKDNYGRNFFHIVAKYANRDAIEYVLSEQLATTYRAQIQEKDQYGRNFFHFVAQSGYRDVIEYVLSEQLPTIYRAQIQEKAKTGSNFFHIVAHSGNRNVIEYVLSEQLPTAYRAQIQEKDKVGRNFFHCVAQSGNCDAIEYVLSDQLPQIYRRLLEHTDNNDYNFFHYMILGADANTLSHFIQNHAVFVASLWVEGSSRRPGPDLFAIDRCKMTITPSSLLKGLYFEAIRRVLDNRQTENDLTLLKAFKKRAMEFLYSPDALHYCDIDRFSRHATIHAIYAGMMRLIKSMMALQQLKQDNQPLSAALVLQVANLLPQSTNNQYRSVFFSNRKEKPPLMVLQEKLRKIYSVLQGSTEPNIEKTAAIVLKLELTHKAWIKTLSANEKYVFYAICSVFFNVAEVSALMPKPDIQADAVSESEFMVHLQQIQEKASRAVSDETDRQTICRVIDGLRYLHNNFDALNQFARRHTGDETRLYFLDQPEQNEWAHEKQNAKLPFHITKYGVDDALKQTCQRTIREFIAAFFLAEKFGKTQEFFQKCVTGFCLEIHVRDVAEWVSQYQNVENLDTLMSGYMAEYQASLRIYDGILKPQEACDLEDTLTFILAHHAGDSHHAGDWYQVLGKEEVSEITYWVVQDYLVDVLCYAYPNEDSSNSDTVESAATSVRDELAIIHDL